MTFSEIRHSVVFVTLQSSARISSFSANRASAIAIFKEIYLTFLIYLKYRSAWFTTELRTALTPEVGKKVSPLDTADALPF